MKGRVLIVDDDRAMCEMIQLDARRREFDAAYCTSAESALQELQAGEFDCVLTDLNMPGANGIEFCEKAHSLKPDLPVVVITAFGSLETAVAAIRAGAYDFVTKPIELDILGLALERAVNNHQLIETVNHLRKSVDQIQRYEDLLGSSPAMQRLFERLTRIADSESPVLIAGESGTGKELAARALHQRSRRKQKPLIAVNCAAVPENLLESELFGHVQGAFTDAHSSRKGLFLQAEGGTLLLDEIGDMPLNLQPKLLRALESRTIRPLGGEIEVPFDVRVITSTNKDIETAVEEGKFRQDLYYRINVIRLDLPPLRSRGKDILLLAQYFIEHPGFTDDRVVTGISPSAAERLLNYSWPGNVRELRNVIEQAVVLTTHSKLAAADLPERFQDHKPSRLMVGAENPAELLTMEEVERRYIIHVLEATNNNQTHAARILGLDRKTLWRKLQRYGTSDDGIMPGKLLPRNGNY